MISSDRGWAIGLLLFMAVCVGLMIWIAWTNRKEEEEERLGGNDDEGFEIDPNQRRENGSIK